MEASVRAQVPAAARARAMSPADGEQFLSELGTLIALGKNLSASLSLRADRQPAGPCRDTLRMLSNTVASGESLGEALSRAPGCFSPIAIAMVRAADRPARLALALHLCLVHHRLSTARSRQQRQCARTCIASILVVAALLMVTYLVLMVVLAPLYRDLGVETPPVVHAVLSLTQAVSDWGWLVAVIAGLAGSGGWLVWRSYVPEVVFARCWCALPLLRSYGKQQLVWRLGLDLGVLLRSGCGEQAAFALAAAQPLARVGSTSRAVALVHEVPAGPWNIVSAMGGLLTTGEHEHLLQSPGPESLGQSLMDIAAQRARAASRIERWVGRVLLGVVFVALAASLDLAWQILSMALHAP